MTTDSAEITIAGTELGYARVSSRSQNLDRQIEALGKAGVARIFPEKVSGRNAEREELRKMLDYARPGDRITVVDLTRLGRNLRDLQQLTDQLAARGIAFRSLKEQIDTTTPIGRFFFIVLAALAELQREIILEAAAEGRAAAKAKGQTGGRPLADAQKIELARELAQGGRLSIAAIARRVGVGRATLYRHGVHEDFPVVVAA